VVACRGGHHVQGWRWLCCDVCGGMPAARHVPRFQFVVPQRQQVLLLSQPQTRHWLLMLTTETHPSQTRQTTQHAKRGVLVCVGVIDRVQRRKKLVWYFRYCTPLVDPLVAAATCIAHTV